MVSTLGMTFDQAIEFDKVLAVGKDSGELVVGKETAGAKVKASIAGAIVTNTLFMLGMSFLLGGRVMAEWLFGDVPFYEGAGCIECAGTGYKGRTAIMEMLLMDGDLDELVHQARAVVRRRGKDRMDFALALTGHTAGGPGKVSVVSSSLFGTVSGSAVANVMVDGWLTIPLMKKTGFRAPFAAAVEAQVKDQGQGLFALALGAVGVEDGDRVVVEGASLINQVR